MSVRSVLAACALPVGSVAVLLVALAVAGELPLALPSAAALVRLSLVLLAGIAFSLAFSTLAWVQVARENKVLGRRKVLEGAYDQAGVVDQVARRLLGSGDV